MEIEDVNIIEVDFLLMKVVIELINYQWGVFGYYQYIKFVCFKEIKEIK